MTRGDLWTTRPTKEQMKEKFSGTLDEGDYYAARWYPQMGGYGAYCWVVSGGWGYTSDGDSPCFDVYVFHDGEFPFDPDPDADAPMRRTAIHLHHCCTKQFIRFGNEVESFLQDSKP